MARVNTHLTIHRLSREVQEQRDQLERELKVVSELQRELLPERQPFIRLPSSLRPLEPFA